MSVRVMANIWDFSPHGGSELLLLLAIADFANDRGLAWPSVPTLAGKIRQSDRNVRHLVRKLKQSGDLEVRVGAGPKGCNLFRLKTFPPVSERTSPLTPVAAGAEIAIAAEPSRTINEPSLVADDSSATHESDDLACSRCFDQEPRLNLPGTTERVCFQCWQTVTGRLQP